VNWVRIVPTGFKVHSRLLMVLFLPDGTPSISRRNSSSPAHVGVEA
jgi:hypothetical protein